jgi:hypothetical protein
MARSDSLETFARIDTAANAILPPCVLVVTGPMVSEAAALGSPPPRHVPENDCRRAEITAEPTREALWQLDLSYRLICRCAAACAGARFTVMYQDVILGAYRAEVCVS